MQVQDDGEGHEADNGAAAAAERHHRPGTSVRGRTERGHDIVVANFEGKGAGRAHRGQDIAVVNSKGEDAGRAEQGHDNVVGMNVKGPREGRSVQGRDIVVEKNVKGAGGEYQNFEGTRCRTTARVVTLTKALLQLQRGTTGSSESRC